MDLEEIGINAGNWVDSAQDRNYWRALRVPYLKVGLNNYRTILEKHASVNLPSTPPHGCSVSRNYRYKFADNFRTRLV